MDLQTLRDALQTLWTAMRRRGLPGERLADDPVHADERAALEQVQCAAVALGLPLPEIRVLEQEAALNAAMLPASTTHGQAVLLTEGALTALTPRELQALAVRLLVGDDGVAQRMVGRPAYAALLRTAYALAAVLPPLGGQTLRLPWVLPSRPVAPEALPAADWERLRRADPRATATALADLQATHALHGRPMGDAPRPAGALPETGRACAVSLQDVSRRRAQPSSADLDRAAALLAAMPEVSRRAVTDREDVGPLLWSLVLDPRPAVAARQCVELEARIGRTAGDQTRDHAERQDALPALLHYPLLHLALPRLQRRPPDAARAIADAFTAMVAADPDADVRAVAMAAVLRARITGERAGRPTDDDPIGLLAAVCRTCHGREADAHAALAPALAHVDARLAARASLRRLPVFELLAALQRLATAPRPRRGRLVDALWLATGHGRVATVGDMERLRWIAAALALPMPAAMDVVGDAVD